MSCAVDRFRVGLRQPRRGAVAQILPSASSSRMEQYISSYCALDYAQQLVERFAERRAARDQLEHLLLTVGSASACLRPVMSRFMPTQATCESGVGSTGTARTETQRHSRLTCRSRYCASNAVRVAMACFQIAFHAARRSSG